jgi:hypothetical protein
VCERKRERERGKEKEREKVIKNLGGSRKRALMLERVWCLWCATVACVANRSHQSTAVFMLACSMGR